MRRIKVKMRCLKYPQNCCLVLILLFAAQTWGQQPMRCSSDEKDRTAPKYRIGQIDRTVSGPPKLVIHISIKAKYFNSEDMLALARLLKKDFCNETRLGIFIFDYHPAAESYAGIPNDNPTYSRDKAALRGFYNLDRAVNEEYVIFSTKRGRAVNENKITLSKP
jgi:hypothetical protein